MYKTITIKIGSNVLTQENGQLDHERIEHLTHQIATLHKQGKKVILISSGAVAAGRGVIKLSSKTDPVSERQLLSSIGQVKLLNLYNSFFDKHSIACAQVLVTKQDFRTREHYLNMKNCLSTLLDNGVLPIINENDAVSVTALMFTDNDELAGLISTMMDSNALFILSNVDGIYNGDPKLSESKVITHIDDNTDLSQYISTTKSNFGRGGMLTKCRIAQKTAASGIDVHIANGTKDNILLNLAHEPQNVNHTLFKAGEHPAAIKKWMAYSEGFTAAEVQINEGAKTALLSKHATSLLLAGVINFKGEFKKGDLLKIVDTKGFSLGIGRAQYDHKNAIKHQFDAKYKPLIHYDYLYLLP